MKNNSGDAVYALGVIGALFYYLSRAGDLKTGIIGIGKSLLWPAFVVFELLKSFNM